MSYSNQGATKENHTSSSTLADQATIYKQVANSTFTSTGDATKYGNEMSASKQADRVPRTPHIKKSSYNETFASG